MNENDPINKNTIQIIKQKRKQYDGTKTMLRSIFNVPHIHHAYYTDDDYSNV